MATTPSLILALHARYEAAWAEHDRADRVQPAKPTTAADPGIHLYYSLEWAMTHNNNETDAVRDALLYQVPSTDEELAILAYHVWSQNESIAGLDDREKLALNQGITTIFDYLVREGRAEMERTGGMFSRAAMIAFDRVRYRTGQVED